MKKESVVTQCSIEIRQAYDMKERVWLILNEGSLLCWMDKSTGVIHQEIQLPNINDGMNGAYEGFCQYGNYFVIAPLRGKTVIAVYNFVEKTMLEIPLRNLKELYNMPKFSMCFTYRDFVYVIGQRYPAIIRLNMKTLETEYITDWVTETDPVWKISDRVYLRPGTVVGNTGFFPFAEAAEVLKVNLDTGDTDIIKIKCSVKGFNGLVYAENKFWLLDRYQAILISWDLQTDAVSEIVIEDEQDNKNFLLFSKIAVAGERLLLIPLNAGHAYWITMKTGTVQLCTELEPYILKNQRKNSSNIAACNLVMQSSNGIYLDFEQDDCFYFYDFLSATWVPIKKKCEKQVAGTVALLRYQNVVSENENEGLDELLRLVLDIELPMAVTMEPELVGENIYQVLKKEVQRQLL